MSGQPFKARFGYDANNQKLIKLDDPVAALDGVNLRTLNSVAGVQLVARLGNLPSPSDPVAANRPRDGQSFLVKYDLAGQPLNRFAVWDAGVPTSGPIAAVSVLVDPADKAAVTAAAGTTDPGFGFDVNAGTGAVLDFTANADGTVTAAIISGGTKYSIGDSLSVDSTTLAFPGMTQPMVVSVTQLGGASPDGGWRFVALEDWIKTARTTADHQYGMRAGDIQFTSELSHEEIKVYDGSAWVTIYSTDTVNASIAALNLFEGTVQEVGGAVVGAVDIAGLPDITDPAIGAANASHYWVWVGTPGYTIKGTDPNGTGAALTGAILQVGDWLQVAKGPGGTFTWAHIGGDLLAKSRADVLYGLHPWVAGNYEKDSLVTYQGGIWRAGANIVTGDVAPDAVGSKWTAITLTAGVRNVPTDGDLPATAPASDVFLVLNSAKAGAKPALYSYDPGTTAWVALGGSASGGQAIVLDQGDPIVNIGSPVGVIMAWVMANPPPGWLICNGQAFDQAVYPELATVLGSGSVPDFRGSFLRGAGLHGNGTWGEAGRTPGGWQGYATALPSGSSPFKTDTRQHRHSMDTNRGTTGWKGGGANDRQLVRQGGGDMTGFDAHFHDVNAGGDAETRPVNFAVNWIIKAADTAQRIRI